jgi:hypothetical protein
LKTSGYQIAFSNDKKYGIVVGAPKNGLFLTGDKIRIGTTNVSLLFAEKLNQMK